MESLNNKDDNQNKSKYLIENIFVSETDSKINTITFNKQFNFNIKEISLNIPLIDQIIINDKLTFFNKKYSNEEKKKLKLKFDKLLYFCYRKNTYPMKTRIGVGISRDSGWGCMIRCGQMIMSRAIYKYLKSKKVSTEKAISETLKYFLDAPYSEQNMPSIFSSILFFTSNLNKIPENVKIFPPFSIQVHCFLGKFYNKYAGEWFSDVNICKNFRDINEIFNIFPEISTLNFVSDLNLSEVLDNCFTLLNNKNEIEDNKQKIFKLKEKEYIMKKCGLIFISVRLGINKVTNEYYSSLKKLFECKECIGIIGGETNLAHYFIGYNDKGNLIYLDPHITRDAIYDLNDDSIINDYLIKNLHEIAINDMSTALSIGFLFRNIEEFEELIQFLENYSKNAFPCFGFIKEKIEIDINKYDNLFNDEDDF